MPTGADFGASFGGSAVRADSPPIPDTNGFQMSATTGIKPRVSNGTNWQALKKDPVYKALIKAGNVPIWDYTPPAGSFDPSQVEVGSTNSYLFGLNPDQMLNARMPGLTNYRDIPVTGELVKFAGKKFYVTPLSQQNKFAQLADMFPNHKKTAYWKEQATKFVPPPPMFREDGGINISGFGYQKRGDDGLTVKNVIQSLAPVVAIVAPAFGGFFGAGNFGAQALAKTVATGIVNVAGAKGIPGAAVTAFAGAPSATVSAPATYSGATVAKPRNADVLTADKSGTGSASTFENANKPGGSILPLIAIAGLLWSAFYG